MKRACEYESGPSQDHVALKYNINQTPILHWMKNKDKVDAPSFWYDSDEPNSSSLDENESRMKLIEAFANGLISTSPDKMTCPMHEEYHPEDLRCPSCKNLQDMVKKYQSHRHTFTCAKKRKSITICETEGHGRLDGLKKVQSYQILQR